MIKKIDIFNGVLSADSGGFIINNKTGKTYKAIKNKYGYPYIQVRFNGRRIGKTVHRLVAKAFIPNPENLPVVNHKNAIKSDNRVENLEWCSRSYNTKHAILMGRLVSPSKFKSGQQNIKAKLKEKDVLDIRADHRKHRQIANHYLISIDTVRSIKYKRIWSWLK